jgi:hypothetical protein
MARTGISLALLAAVTQGVAACSGAANSGPDEVVSTDEAFVAVPRPMGAPAAVKTMNVPGADAKESFYLAINKRELGQRYFLSAFLKQYFPGAVIYDAASSLGTKVVTFRVQNGKLFGVWLRN